jgi:hypothetical protein
LPKKNTSPEQPGAQESPGGCGGKKKRLLGRAAADPIASGCFSHLPLSSIAGHIQKGEG